MTGRSQCSPPLKQCHEPLLIQLALSSNANWVVSLSFPSTTTVTVHVINYPRAVSTNNQFLAVQLSSSTFPCFHISAIVRIAAIRVFFRRFRGRRLDDDRERSSLISVIGKYFSVCMNYLCLRKHISSVMYAQSLTFTSNIILSNCV